MSRLMFYAVCMRSVRITGWTLMWLGLMILLYVGGYVVGTNAINRREQSRLHEVSRPVLESRVAGLPEPEVSDDSDGEVVSWYPEKPVLTGELAAVIRIPAIDVDAVVLQGVGVEELKKGPGHMEWTAYPGQPGNSVISGHRSTYGAPFRRVHELEAGDLIEVDTALGTHTYAVREILIVKPTDVWVTDHRSGAWLTLTACHPIGSARERIVIVAELIEGKNFDYVASATA